ncbi:MAG: type II toxin-antitoxin system RelE/ParE family toxin [Dehalococcoidia bacterium]|nr:type II toxin-antitoxin system RelE/ParE family toxin [Dehalococcoidia bacterium]
MTYSISFLRAAESDLEDACRWYEIRGERLGSALLQSVQDVLNTIERYPRIHPIVHNEVRRAEVARFPYGIIYVVKGDTILIIGVFHNSRDPNQWQARL